MIQLVDQPIDLLAVIAAVQAPTVGGIDLFVGTVRDHAGGRPVRRLDFEAYPPMALHQMRKLAQAAHQRWPLEKVALVHRVGQLQIGEVAVAIAVGAAHRQAAFEACRYLIDTLKETVPIWKHEHYADGSVWVAAHP
jgi:molybdopterin synthase catalytic subunit